MTRSRFPFVCEFRLMASCLVLKKSGAEDSGGEIEDGGGRNHFAG